MPLRGAPDAGHRRRRPGRAPSSLVEVRVRSGPSGDPLGVRLRRTSLRMRLVSCRPYFVDGRPRLLRWIDLQGPPAELERLAKELRLPGSSDPDVRMSVGRGRAALRASGPLPRFCAEVFGAGGVCVACPLLSGADERLRVRARVLLSRDAAATRFAEALGRRDLGPVERTGPFRAHGSRTPRQEQALRTAFELGFFAYPRRATLGDVARTLGVGRSAALELLRRAVSDLVAHQFIALYGTEDRF